MPRRDTGVNHYSTASSTCSDSFFLRTPVSGCRDYLLRVFSFRPPNVLRSTRPAWQHKRHGRWSPARLGAILGGQPAWVPYLLHSRRGVFVVRPFCCGPKRECSKMAVYHHVFSHIPSRSKIVSSELHCSAVRPLRPLWGAHTMSSIIKTLPKSHQNLDYFNGVLESTSQNISLLL